MHYNCGKHRKGCLKKLISSVNSIKFLVFFQQIAFLSFRVHLKGWVF
uniref:Uncharacterized protein n=1 Tax=Rhizophora mucronata TaxID=61149 RepID=A0A2P2NV87_RHIMU